MNNCAINKEAYSLCKQKITNLKELVTLIKNLKDLYHKNNYLFPEVRYCCVNKYLIIIRIFDNQHNKLCLINLTFKRITLDDIFKNLESKLFHYNFESRFFKMKSYEYIILENL